MKISFFDTHNFERAIFEEENARRPEPHEIVFLETRLNEKTASLAAGSEAVCCFVNDKADRESCRILAANGVKLISLRSAGFNNVDLKAAGEYGIRVVRVPAYSPYAVAEHAVALILALNRKIHRAHARVHELNFSLDGLVGFDLHGKTVGVLGTGKIGRVFARIMRDGFGCEVLAYDKTQSEGFVYASLDEIFSRADILSLHLPLVPETKHIIDATAFGKMKTGVMLINTGRGALVDSAALIEALKSRKLGYAGLDVYEEEEGVFFRDLSSDILQDDNLARLLSFPNTIITSHQAFLTKEALRNIAETSLRNLEDWRAGASLVNEVPG